MESQLKNYNQFFEEVYAILGNLTPLSSDCGRLCNKACCKGDEQTGMRLFPNESSPLQTKEVEGGILAVCNGKCERDQRPLSCRIFPFFPSVSEDGRIKAKIDMRAFRLCPMAENSESIRFDRDFIKAVRKAGRLLSKDAECLSFMKETTAEIELLEKLYGKAPKFSKRK